MNSHRKADKLEKKGVIDELIERSEGIKMVNGMLQK